MAGISRTSRRSARAAFRGLFFSAEAQSRRVAPTPTPTPQDDVERVNTEEIKLNVLAFDENGAFFNDVSAKDLVITENNILHVPGKRSPHSGKRLDRHGHRWRAAKFEIA